MLTATIFIAETNVSFASLDFLLTMPIEIGLGPSRQVSTPSPVGVLGSGSPFAKGSPNLTGDYPNLSIWTAHKLKFKQK